MIQLCKGEETAQCICDMFFETPAKIIFAGYADDKTLYTYSSNIENVLEIYKEH